MTFSLLSRQHYPEGASHLLPLLELIIPGIDMNDPLKSFASLMFISHVAMCVPFWDLTEISRNTMDIDETEIDQIIRIGTSGFEAWILKFLERVFVMFENLPQQYGHHSNNSTMESSLIRLLLHTCEVTFSQLSPSLHNLVIRKIVEFARSNVIPNATKAIGFLAAAACGSENEKALPLFITLCKEKILEELEHGASSVHSSSFSTTHPFGFHSMSDASLHWYQSILYHVVFLGGIDVYHHRQDLLKVIRAMTAKCHTRRGYKWTFKLIQNILTSLTGVYPLENRCVNSAQWNDPGNCERLSIFFFFSEEVYFAYCQKAIFVI